jgi:lipopolysaccharide biosynthesis glycosyltransferase
MAKPNISVRVIYTHEYNIDEALFESFAIREHFTIETYFRFFIPKLFEKYNKVLYLDCDMIVLRDIADLYAEDIGGNWWGVTHDNNIFTLGFDKETWEYKNYMPYVKNTLKIDSPFNYFQAGVMIWNIKQCIKDNVFDKLMKKLAEIGKPHYVDQDIMNSVANGKNIFWISNYWNVPWYYKFNWLYYKGHSAYDTIIHQLENPFIIHYAGGVKPWIEPYKPNAHYFWQYARNTPFYETLLHSLTHTMLSHEINNVNNKINSEINREINKHNEEKEHFSLEQITDGINIKRLIKRIIKLMLKKLISPFFPLGSRRRRYIKRIYYSLRGLESIN